MNHLKLGKKQTVISLLIITILTLSTFTGIIAVIANVEPSEHSVTITSGQSYTTEITKTVYNPAIPPKLDLLLLEDETGSFVDDIDELQGDPPLYENGLAEVIWDAIDAEVADFYGAVAGFRDFSVYGWGSSGDWVYKKYADFTNDKSTWLGGIMSLSAYGGYDTPEAQLAALKSAADGSAWDSNMDGDTADAEDTPAGENPSWRDDATKVIVLVTDANYHVYGDPEFVNDPTVVKVWPGPTYAATVAALNAEGIHVIILATSGSASYYNQLATDTDGSVQLISSDSSDIVDAIMTALEEIVTDVWWTASGNPEINVSLTPDVHYDVTGDTTVTFTEIINVPSGLAVGTYTSTVTFWANSYPEEGATLGTETITVTVEPEPVEIDIKPNSDPNAMNPRSKGSIPVAIITTDSFDATTVDPATVRFGPDDAEPNHKGYCGHVEDYDGDGDLDVIYHFKIQDTGIQKGDTSATLTGQTYGGVYVAGTDSVKTAGK